MVVTILRYIEDDFHGEADEYVDKIIAQRTYMPYCVRCQGTHTSIQWKRITNPKMSSPKGVRASAIIAWAMCPTLNEPILIKAWADNETESQSV